MTPRFSLFVGGALLLAACSGSAAADSAGKYSVKVPLPAELNGFTAYIMNYDTQEPVDSVVVASDSAIFNGSVEKPILASMVVKGDRIGTFILEPGNITFSQKEGFAGTPLNTTLNNLGDSLQSVVDEFKALPQAQSPDSATQAKIDALQTRFEAISKHALEANKDNPVGLYLFLQDAYELPDATALDSVLKIYPQFANSHRVAQLRDSYVKKEATSPGHKFTDFTIEYNGKTQKLSDYVGKGKWTLVDFWASWCGPCVRETRTLKQLLNDLGPKGLEVVGVAVWDEPENTEAAIKRLQLPWPQIINAQQVPTDLYGIKGIPCILLIDPEGNIVLRDLQGPDLVEAVTRLVDK